VAIQSKKSHQAAKQFMTVLIASDSVG
jgi:hypothetical protein